MNTNYFDYVQKKGQLRTEAHAHRWSAAVLKTLGTALDRGTKRALAKALPDEEAHALTGVFWLLHFRDKEMTAWEFQERVARRSGNTDPAFARIPIVAVFGGIQQQIDDQLNQRVADALAPEIREIWRQARQPVSKETRISA